MSVVVGYLPHVGGRASLDLALQLAHALDEDLSVVTVVPRQWSTPSMARVDAEYAEYAQQVGEEAERQARLYLSETTVTVQVSYRTVTGRSVAAALLEAVHTSDTKVLVLGSATDGQVGRVVVGSTVFVVLAVTWRSPWRRAATGTAAGSPRAGSCATAPAPAR